MTAIREAYGNRFIDYDNELQNQEWQKRWEELSGSNSTAPSRWAPYGSTYNLQPRGYKDPFLQEQALQYKRKQQALSRQRFKESFDEEKWRDQYRKNRTDTPLASATMAQPSQYGSMSMGPNPSMQSPFQF